MKINKSQEVPRDYTGIVEFPNGDKYWLLDGKYHRVDGPAIEISNGANYYWLNDKWYTEEDYNKKINLPITDG